jgi:hypothetical protein
MKSGTTDRNPVTANRNEIKFDIYIPQVLRTITVPTKKYAYFPQA